MRLTEYSHGAGWACKLSQKELAQVLKHFKQQNKSDSHKILVGLDTPDDGGVIELQSGVKIIQTVDFFTPILDNPFDWGRVAAANALSDIYAMGGKPLSALQLVSWPREDLSFEILSEVLNGGLQIMKSKKCLIYFDTGKPPKKNFSSEYQSAPLAFELFVENEKIITNCGFGKNISQKAILLSRLTSAQSTLSLNDTSVAKFERNKSLNSAFGYSLKNSFKIFNHDFKEDQTMVETTAAHDAYEKIFGYNYKRKLLIEKTTNSIYGFDTLNKKIENTPATYNIRFHLYPGITAVQTISGKSILIQVKKNKSLIFTAENENVRVEKSIFLGRNKILNNLCITISGKIADEKKIINWEIKRNT